MSPKNSFLFVLATFVHWQQCLCNAVCNADTREYLLKLVHTLVTMHSCTLQKMAERTQT